MGPLVLTRDFDTLEEAYTSVRQKDIFNYNPFNKKGKLSLLKVLWRLILHKKTVGESKNLRKLIPKFFQESNYDEIRALGCEFTATLACLTQNETAFKSTADNSYTDMIDWIWGSANQPVFMSLMEKNGRYWGDGGLKDYLPISYVIGKGARHIDVVVHNTPTFTDTDWAPKGTFINTLFRAINILSVDVAEDNIENAKLQVELGEEHNMEIDLNFYFMSQSLVDKTENSLIFDKEIMREILNTGYQSVLDGTVIKKVYKVDSNGAIHAGKQQAQEG
ncbi:MAG: patatin-like phospholipase family protein, partial [Flammeovirgaceae bacterium]